jgi:hypothetical protein
MLKERPAVTVAEMIEELKRQPNQHVPVSVHIVTRRGPDSPSRPAEYVHFDGGKVVIEGE